MLELGTWRSFQAIEIAVVENGIEKAAEIEKQKNITSSLLTFIYFLLQATSILEIQVEKANVWVKPRF